ncbi:MAG: discoidin domain-containing protein [Phycisphaerae bacterium]|nr:discoidin domain-containing protein [Phycisphaerae bacterium]
MSHSSGIVAVFGLAVGLLAHAAGAEQVKPPPGTKTDAKPNVVTAADRGHVNVAKGKPYKLDPAPSYKHCADPGDKTQLTDGQHVSGYFWVQKGTVGWSHAGRALITIDLGKVEPIRGVSFRTAAGTAGVGWPQQLSIFVSQDGKDYACMGDLVELSSKREIPSPLGYREYTYWTDELKTKGRYVQIALVFAGAYGFCDEIEVWRGEDAWLNQPVGGKNVGNVKTFLETSAVTTSARRRLRMDAGQIRKAVETSRMSAEKRAQTLDTLDGLSAQIGSLDVDDPKTFRAIVPLNELHRKILALNAKVLQARGLQGLVVWHKNRWEPLGVLEAPESKPAQLPELSLRVMRGEYRAVALNLTNATDGLCDALIRFAGLPDCLTAHQVEHVDTKQGVVVSDALPAAQKLGKDAVVLRIPPGTTRQVWLTVHATSIEPGVFPGKINVYPVKAHAGRPVTPAQPCATVAFSLRVEPIDFPRHPTLSLGTWDYTNHPPYQRDLTAENIRAAIADAKAHFQDAPWATSSVMPFPQKAQLDADGNLKTEMLDYARFDKWFNDWKDYARRYMIFSNVPTSVAGLPMGTPKFDKLVGQWAAAWAEHCKKLGIKPKQVALLIVDEPSADAQHKHIAAWAKAIRAATDFFSIWEDPVDKKLGTPAQNEMLELCDAVCPNLGIWNTLGKKAQDFYGELVADGKRELWFYQCTGPVRLLCPYGYHRLQAWHCWAGGAVGQGFWAYADAGGGDAWCEYLCRGTTYSPAYVGRTGITTSKHWEAVREGIEDYEYLHMLKTRIDELIKAGKTGPELDKARKLLVEGPKRVAVYEPIHWHQQRDRSLAAQVRLEILDALLALK